MFNTDFDMNELVKLAKRLDEDKKEIPKYVKMNPSHYYELLKTGLLNESPEITPKMRAFGLKILFDETVETYKFIYEDEEI